MQDSFYGEVRYNHRKKRKIMHNRALDSDPSSLALRLSDSYVLIIDEDQKYTQRVHSSLENLVADATRYHSYNLADIKADIDLMTYDFVIVASAVTSDKLLDLIAYISGQKVPVLALLLALLPDDVREIYKAIGTNIGDCREKTNHYPRLESYVREFVDYVNTKRTHRIRYMTP
jgi:hypothetical protein